MLQRHRSHARRTSVFTASTEMSFLSLRPMPALSTRSSTSATCQLTDDILTTIFLYCDPVSLTRCSVVCRDWRRLVLEAESEGRVFLSRQRARIFICDRRRAILEKLTTPKFDRFNLSRSAAAASHFDTNSPPSKLCSRDENGAGPSSVFIVDQYANTDEPCWAYKFDFDSFWTSNYEITEVCLQNFCSFLEREHGKMESGHKSDKTNEASGGTRSCILTPPSSNESSVSLSSSQHSSTAYHRLPSNQSAAAYSHLDCLKDECIKELQRLSATRVERLARSLHRIRPLHLIFRDHSFYQHRPTVILFYFAQLLHSSLRSLTLDGIQGETSIPLNRLFSLENIEKLIVRQPTQRCGIRVSIEVLLGWLNLEAKHRRPIQIELFNCRDITPQSLAHFVLKWRKTAEICMFKSIQLDYDSMRITELVRELEHPTDDYDLAQEAESWRLQTPPQPALGHGISLHELETRRKVLRLPHFRQRNVYIEYRVIDDMITLTCKRDEVTRMKQMSTSSGGSLSGSGEDRMGGQTKRKSTVSRELSAVSAAATPGNAMTTVSTTGSTTARLFRSFIRRKDTH